MWDSYQCTGSWMPFGWLWFAIFWVVIVGLAIWIVKKIMGRYSPDRMQSALDIAKKRYARGEISSEEFEQMKREL